MSVRQWFVGVRRMLDDFFLESRVSALQNREARFVAERVERAVAQSGGHANPLFRPIDFAESLSRHRSRYASAAHPTRAGESSI